jgi:hypothetical protein
MGSWLFYRKIKKLHELLKEKWFAKMRGRRGGMWTNGENVFIRRYWRKAEGVGVRVVEEVGEKF